VRLGLCMGVLATLLAAAAADATPSRAAGAEVCGNPGYSYAGFQHRGAAHGVRATLSAIARPYVASGHVAAWVGVGGPGAGPNGADEWIQVGLSAFSDGSSQLYYEITRPGAPPTYHQVDADVRPGERKRVVVLEMSRRPNHWRVWVNGKPVSLPVYLPGSSGRWRPIATAETWDGGRRVCNGFAYRFERVRVAGWRGGSWRRFRGAYRFQDPGYRVQPRARAGFRALAMAAPVWRATFWSQRAAAAAAAAPAPAPAPPPQPAPPPADLVETTPAPPASGDVTPAPVG
jgi:hypothetical protein